MKNKQNNNNNTANPRRRVFGRSVLDFETEDRLRKALLSAVEQQQQQPNEDNNNDGKQDEDASVSGDRNQSPSPLSLASAGQDEEEEKEDAITAAVASFATQRERQQQQQQQQQRQQQQQQQQQPLDWVLLTNLDPNTTELQSMKHELNRLLVLKSYCILESRQHNNANNNNNNNRDRKEQDEDDTSCFDRLTRLAAQYFRTPVAMITMMDLGRQWILSQIGAAHMAGQDPQPFSSSSSSLLLPQQQQQQQDNSNTVSAAAAAAAPGTATSILEIPRQATFCQHAILHKQKILMVPDASNDERFANLAAVTDGNIRFYAGVPLLAPEGYKIGTFCIADTKPRPSHSTTMSTEEIQMLLELAEMAMRLVSRRKSNLVWKTLEQQQDILQGCISPQMIAYTSHDLMTPLTGVQLSLSILREDCGRILNPRQQELLKQAADCSDFMLRIGQTAMNTLGECRQRQNAAAAQQQQQLLPQNKETTSATRTADGHYNDDNNVRNNNSPLHPNDTAASDGLFYKNEPLLEELPITNLRGLVDSLALIMKPNPKTVPLAITLVAEEEGSNASASGTLEAVYCDDLVLLRSCLNLISNGLRRTKSGLVELRISVKESTRVGPAVPSSLSAGAATEQEQLVATAAAACKGECGAVVVGIAQAATTAGAQQPQPPLYNLFVECTDTGPEIPPKEYAHLFHAPRRLPDRKKKTKQPPTTPPSPVAADIHRDAATAGTDEKTCQEKDRSDDEDDDDPEDWRDGGLGLLSVATLIHSLDGEYGFKPPASSSSRRGNPSSTDNSNSSKVPPGSSPQERRPRLEGSTFWFRVPVTAVQLSNNPTITTEEQVETAEQGEEEDVVAEQAQTAAATAFSSAARHDHHLARAASTMAAVAVPRDGPLFQRTAPAAPQPPPPLQQKAAPAPLFQMAASAIQQPQNVAPFSMFQAHYSSQPASAHSPASPRSLFQMAAPPSQQPAQNPAPLFHTATSLSQPQHPMYQVPAQSQNPFLRMASTTSAALQGGGALFQMAAPSSTSAGPLFQMGALASSSTTGPLFHIAASVPTNSSVPSRPLFQMAAAEATAPSQQQTSSNVFQMAAPTGSSYLHGNLFQRTTAHQQQHNTALVATTTMNSGSMPPNSSSFSSKGNFTSITAENSLVGNRIPSFSGTRNALFLRNSAADSKLPGAAGGGKSLLHASSSYKRPALADESSSTSFGDQSGQHSKRLKLSDQQHHHQQQHHSPHETPVCLLATDTPTQYSNEALCRLEQSGWKVVVVHEASDALRLLKMRHWNVVLLDDDISCCKEFRAWEHEHRQRQPRQENVFLVVTTAKIPSALDPNTIILPPTGYNGALGKPVQWKELKHLMDEQDRQRQAYELQEMEEAGLSFG